METPIRLSSYLPREKLLEQMLQKKIWNTELLLTHAMAYRPIARKWPHVTHATRAELFEAMFSVRALPWLFNGRQLPLRRNNCQTNWPTDRRSQCSLKLNLRHCTANYRPVLSSERAPYKTPRRTGRLTVGRNVTSTST
jgi:hypothetical protein